MNTRYRVGEEQSLEIYNVPGLNCRKYDVSKPRPAVPCHGMDSQKRLPFRKILVKKRERVRATVIRCGGDLDKVTETQGT